MFKKLVKSVITKKTDKSAEWNEKVSSRNYVLGFL